MDAWLWWLCMAAPISMLLIYGDTILYLWIFWFLCSHAPSSLLLIQSSIIYIYICILYIYYIHTHIYIYVCVSYHFQKAPCFHADEIWRPGAVWSLPGASRPWRKEDKQETMGNPLRSSAKCPEPLRSPVRSGQNPRCSQESICNL